MTAKPASPNRAARAGAWSAIEILFRNGLQFAVTVALARLLPPEDFGLVALLAVFTGLSAVVVEAGPSIALIRNPSTTPVQESSVFWFNQGAGILCAAVLLALAPLVATFYGFSIIRPLMTVAAAQVVFAALGAVPYAMLARSLQFRALFYVGAASSLLSGAVGIYLAANGFGVWALSLQALTAAVANTTMLWLLCRWRPSFRFNLRESKALLRFGSHFVTSGFLDVMFTQGFALIIGKMHGIRDVGLYSRAHSAQALPIGIVGQIIGRVSLPVLAANAQDPVALRQTVRRSISLAMAINLPMMVGLSVLSDLVIVTLFGPVWLPSAQILTVLAIFGSFYPANLINVQVLLAQDRSQVFLWSTVAKQSFGVLTVIVGSFFGIMGLAYSQIVYGIVGYVITTRLSERYIGYGTMAQLKDLRGLLCLAAAMGLAVFAMRPFLAAIPSMIQLIVLTGLGAAFYVGMGVVFRVSAIVDGLSLARELASSVRQRKSRTQLDV